MMNESLKTLKTDNKVSDIVNEIIDESFEEEINLDDLSNQDNNLDEVNKELEEARKMYEKLLKEENKTNKLKYIIYIYDRLYIRLIRL